MTFSSLITPVGGLIVLCILFRMAHTPSDISAAKKLLLVAALCLMPYLLLIDYVVLAIMGTPLFPLGWHALFQMVNGYHVSPPPSDAKMVALLYGVWAIYSVSAITCLCTGRKKKFWMIWLCLAVFLTLNAFGCREQLAMCGSLK